MRILRNFALCICTYQRAELLTLFLHDLSAQSLQPDTVIVVDGDPRPSSVFRKLGERGAVDGQQILYLPSNHPNLPYQRYLGWCVARRTGASWILYLDDDLRLTQLDAIEKLLLHLKDDPRNVGVTCMIRFGEMGGLTSEPSLAEHSPSVASNSLLVRAFGSGRKISPAGLSPVGDRVLPSPTNDYASVEWLRGGVMLYRMDALSQDCFSADLFALYHIRCGRGEDTFLSRRVMQRGRLIWTNNVVFDHPNSDLPKTYPISSYKLAYATAYSRRFLNDHYRISRPPGLMDRFALLRSYLGNNLLNLGQAVLRPRRHRFAYAIGYLAGSVRGLLHAPTARNLAPHIDWWADAEPALSELVAV